MSNTSKDTKGKAIIMDISEMPGIPNNYSTLAKNPWISKQQLVKALTIYNQHVKNDPSNFVVDTNWSPDEMAEKQAEYILKIIKDEQL